MDAGIRCHPGKVVSRGDSLVASFLPSLTAYDPPDGEEGTLDPLGLALLATRIAELLVPGFTERLRRPRFFIALAIGLLLLSRRERYPEGVYGIERDGPGYLAWERLLVESFAQSGKQGDEGLLGVPGIQKARDAKASKARLSSQLYLKNPAAVGLWVAYKSLAVDVGILDKEGNLGEPGARLISAWSRGSGQADPNGASGASWLTELDDALAPLLGRGTSKASPQRVWDLLCAKLHPFGMTRPEAEATEQLLRGPDAQRDRVFDFIERENVASQSEATLTEPDRLALMASDAREELQWRARLAATFEALVGQVITAFSCILFAAGEDRMGSASAGLTLHHGDVGPIFEQAPARIGRALAEFDAALRVAAEPAGREGPAGRAFREICDLQIPTLEWLRRGALDSPSALFDALIARHSETQKRKPPAGKRRWIEGEHAARASSHAERRTNAASGRPLRSKPAAES